MNLRRLAAGAIAAAAAAVVLVAPLSSAAVAATAPSVTVSSSVSGGAANVAGSAHMAGLLGVITGVHVDVVRRADSVGVANCDGCGAPLDQDATVSYSLSTPSLAYNGPYDVTATATGRELINGVLAGDVASPPATSTFHVEVKPAVPAGVKAVVNPDRSVTVSWARNTEPDLVGYQVQRRTAGTGAFSAVPPGVPQPASGSRVSFDDTSTTAGGNFEYVVVAVRPDGDGKVTGAGGATSRSAVTGSVAVPTPDGQPVPPGPPAAPGPVAKPAANTTAAGALDLSSFLAKPGGLAPPKISLPGALPLPDGTFDPTLPILGAQRPRTSTDSSDGAAIREESGGGSDRRALMLPIAGGLILCMTALHLRWFNRRTAAGGPVYLPLGPDDPTAGEGTAPAVEPDATGAHDMSEELGTRRADDAVAIPGDAAADVADDEIWAADAEQHEPALVGAPADDPAG